MGKYIGVVETKGTYYNFKPLVEIGRNGSLSLMDDAERERLLPESKKLNINISYNLHDSAQAERAKNMFDNDRVLVLEFEPDDLQPNLTPERRRNDTGYKIQFQTAINTGKLHLLQKEGLYFVLRKEDLLSDFRNSAIVQLEKGSYGERDKVFVDQGGVLTGPYTVGLRKVDNALYIKPDIQANKYTLRGYNKRNACSTLDVEYKKKHWGDENPDFYAEIAAIKAGAVETYIDVISDEQLLDGFKDSVSSKVTKNGKIDLDKMEDLLKNYRTSELSGSGLPADIQKARFERLKAIFTSTENENTVLSDIADTIANLLINHQDNENVELLIDRIIESRPDFIDNLQSSKIVQERKEQKEAELAEMQERLDKVRQEYEEAEKNLTSEENIKKLTGPIEEKLAKDKAELEEITKRLGIASDIDSLMRREQAVKKDTEYLERHKSELYNDVMKAEVGFTEVVSKYQDRMVDIAFDGFVANKLTKAASEWEARQEEVRFERLVEEEKTLELEQMDKETLIDYICSTVQIERPQYSRNMIINVMTCVYQGLLTVFSGEPGCGKTSFCRIIGKALGLSDVHNYMNSDIDESLKDRFANISVERGWTSKRDLVGYYNPLTQTFDQSNRRVYEALKLLDHETKSNVSRLPYLILLDEANLSPMEYYWADFMNICDDLDENSVVNLGGTYIFRIPETLRFLATMNNDHTTEILSPRLIDRAWVITLPRTVSVTLGEKITKDNVQLLQWKDIREAFGCDNKPISMFSPVTQKLYDGVISLLKKQKTVVSPRTELAIRRYWTVAATLMEKDELDIDPSVIALDYAIAQKILPKIQGNGEQYRNWLKELLGFCENNYLTVCSRIIGDIIDRGDLQMKYYQFFN